MLTFNLNSHLFHYYYCIIFCFISRDFVITLFHNNGWRFETRKFYVLYRFNINYVMFSLNLCYPDVSAEKGQSLNL